MAPSAPSQIANPGQMVNLSINTRPCYRFRCLFDDEYLFVRGPVPGFFHSSSCGRAGRPEWACRDHGAAAPMAGRAPDAARCSPSSALKPPNKAFDPTVVVPDIVMPETNGTGLVPWLAAPRARRLARWIAPTQSGRSCFRKVTDSAAILGAGAIHPRNAGSTSCLGRHGETRPPGPKGTGAVSIASTPRQDWVGRQEPRGNGIAPQEENPGGSRRASFDLIVLPRRPCCRNTWMARRNVA